MTRVYGPLFKRKRPRRPYGKKACFSPTEKNPPATPPGIRCGIESDRRKLKAPSELALKRRSQFREYVRTFVSGWVPDEIEAEHKWEFGRQEAGSLLKRYGSEMSAEMRRACWKRSRANLIDFDDAKWDRIDIEALIAEQRGVRRLRWKVGDPV